MKIHIEVYRNHTIEYDYDADKFVCDIELNDEVRNTKRGSLKNLRKEIDLFIKENSGFVPFDYIACKYSNEYVVMHCAAIRTDGKFVVYKKENAHYKEHIPREKMKEVFVYDPDFVKNMEEADQTLEKARDTWRAYRENLKKQLVPLDVTGK